MDEELFHVIDLKTGKEPDLEQIALKEEWAKNLVYCDMEGFLVDPYGCLTLTDECGNSAYCPADRFKIIWHARPDPQEKEMKDAIEEGGENEERP